MSEYLPVDYQTGEIIPQSQLRQALALAKTSGQLGQIEDVATRARDIILLERQSVAAANEYAEIALEAAAARGRLLGPAEHVPGPGRGKPSGASDGFTRDQRMRYRQITKVFDEQHPEYEKLLAKLAEQGEIYSKAKVLNLYKQLYRKADIEQQRADIEAGVVLIPDGEFNVIVIDPPWPYGDGKTQSDYDSAGHRASNPYPEMSIAELAALELPAHDDCVLWLWTTHRFMRSAFVLLDAWGFEEKAILTWVKDRMGLGRWLRSQSEFCIMAVRGKPQVLLESQTTVLHGPMREHSRKPDEFYSMVEGLCPGRRLDWFSREAREGWEQVGNEPEKFE